MEKQNLTKSSPDVISTLDINLIPLLQKQSLDIPKENEKKKSPRGSMNLDKVDFNVTTCE
jgi:hypothetical protein